MKTNTQNKKNIRIGERRVMNNGLWAEIVDYQNAHHIEVRFDTGEKTIWSQYSKFKRGGIADPNRNDQYIGLTQTITLTALISSQRRKKIFGHEEAQEF